MPEQATRSLRIPCIQQLPAHTPHACGISTWLAWAFSETLGVCTGSQWRSGDRSSSNGAGACYARDNLVLMTNKYSQVVHVHSTGRWRRVNGFFITVNVTSQDAASGGSRLVGWGLLLANSHVDWRRLLAAALGRIRGGKRGQRGGKEAAASLLLRAAAFH